MTDSRTEIYVHFVWATWDRRPMLSPSNAALASQAISAKAEELGCQMLAVGGSLDHIHVLLRLPAVLSVARAVRHLKGSSSHLVTHSPEGDPTFKWQGGYAAISVSPQSVGAVVQYIRNQATHHKNGTTDRMWEP